jgi:DNA-binding transcriptional LysR family regulator
MFAMPLEAPYTGPLQIVHCSIICLPGRDRPMMNWDQIDLNLLVTFDTVMQERNLTRAGRRLGLSQPATSHALARLRATLGDELFVRTPEGMQPTQRAEEMAPPIREALRVLRLAMEPRVFDPATSTRGFTLAVNNYAARALVPSLVHRVAEAAPDVTLDIRPIGYRDVLDMLDGDGVDLAVTGLIEGGERFKCVRVMEDDYVAVFDANHPLAQTGRPTGEALAEFPHIVLNSKGDDTSFVDEALEERDLRRKIVARVPFLSIALMLIGSKRIAVIPRRVATDLATICPVVAKELPFASPRVTLSMLWHRRGDTYEAHRWLREMVRHAVAR